MRAILSRLECPRCQQVGQTCIVCKAEEAEREKRKAWMAENLKHRGGKEQPAPGTRMETLE